MKKDIFGGYWTFDENSAHYTCPAQMPKEIENKEIDMPEVTHEVYFGENIKRLRWLLRSILKPK